MDSRSRLLTLMGGTDFSFDTEFNDLGRAVKVWNRLVTESAVCSDEKQGRILDLIYLNMAEVLQPVAIGKYGDASTASIRRVLTDRCLKPEVKLGVEKIIQLFKDEAIANPTLDDCQRDAICQFYDLIQRNFIEYVAQGVGRFRLVPVEETPQIAIVLADMAREVTRARNNSRCS